MAGQAIKQEVVRDPRPRLQQLRAVNTKYSDASRHVLWSAPYKLWLTVEPSARGGYIITHYNGCPCSDDD